MAGRPWLVRQAGPPARAALWWTLRSRGREVTARSASAPCLVLAAHPDDETLGCAATIMRKRDAGTPVTVVIATDGRHSTTAARTTPSALAARRASEAVVAGRAMGLASEDITLLNFEDGRLQDESDQLAPIIAALLERHEPDEVLVTSRRDPHPDHATLGMAARRAVALWGRRRVRILEYPIWQWRTPRSWLPHGRWSALAALRPELVSTEGYLARKRVALEAYESQTKRPLGEPDWWTMDDRFVVNFFRSYELFLPVPPGSLD